LNAHGPRLQSEASRPTANPFAKAKQSLFLDFQRIVYLRRIEQTTRPRRQF
jgi:hypothetical protein